MFTIHRSKENPILTPSDQNPWEAQATFNGCPIVDGNTTHLFYRAMSRTELLTEPHISHSIIGKATSTDGVHFDNRIPFIAPAESFDQYGCEDPRVIKIEGRYYIFYTALGNFPFSADGIKVAVAISDDLVTVKERHLVTPFNAKAMTLFPEKINGKYVALFTVHSDLPDTDIVFAEFDTIEDLWSETYWHDWYEHRHDHVLSLHRTADEQVEIGAVPVKVAEGWLLIYSHTSSYFSSSTHRFGVEAVLLDAKNPKSILGRTKESFMTAETYYEQHGIVPEIVFPSGALLRGDYLDIYYGAADTFCCKCTVLLSTLMAAILPDAKKLFLRAPENPILTARAKCDWEAHGVFNPAAIEIDRTIYILYRAMSSDDTSTVGLAVSKDGITITERLSKPIYTPRGEYEIKHQPGNSGCEDARIVEIKGRLYITYTAYDGFVPRVAVSSISKEDFVARKWKNWSLPEIITPMSLPEKDTCIIPEKGPHGYTVLHRAGTSICGDVLKSLDFSTEKITRCIEMISPRPGMWDSRKAGISGPPIKTAQGWLLLYHGISDSGAYRVGAALLDSKDPTIVLARTALPIFEPEQDYELSGVIPNVVFPCGSVKRGDKLFVYYGGADTVTCVATTKISSILKTLNYEI
jgi:predicted GH43/DUF377 family glycosyl hydrolase